jgi:phosphoribosylamine--glycine ligase
MNKVLIIGSGAREHAIADAFKRSKNISQIFVSPGNDGIRKEFECLKLDSFEEIALFVEKNDIAYVFVGNEQPLSEGICDFLENRNIKVIGPSQKAARIESSKVFSKDLMRKYNIPTAKYEVFEDCEACCRYLEGSQFPIVLKADGLAAGKGVVIAQSLNEAQNAVNQLMKDKKFGEAGNKIVVEGFLTGEEASVFAFSDGKTFVSTIFAQDHKAVYDGDRGPNTGGMGAFAPVDKFIGLKEKVDSLIIKPTLEAMEKEGCPFKGVLFAGLMINKEKVDVIEFNCRLGDPETEVILPLLETDFDELCQSILNSSVANINLIWKDSYAETVVAASEGYPDVFEKGNEIKIEASISGNNGKLFYAGVKENNGCLVNSGGRVLCTTGFGNSLKEAIEEAYAMLGKVTFSNKYNRSDIAQKGLK